MNTFIWLLENFVRLKPPSWHNDLALRIITTAIFALDKFFSISSTKKFRLKVTPLFHISWHYLMSITQTRWQWYANKYMSFYFMINNNSAGVTILPRRNHRKYLWFSGTLPDDILLQYHQKLQSALPWTSAIPQLFGLPDQVLTAMSCWSMFHEILHSI